MRLLPIEGVKDGGLLLLPPGTVEVKADSATGEVTAIFATLGVKDLHGDIIERGAIGKQAVIMSSYGHGSWEAGWWTSDSAAWPIGKGAVHEDEDKAIFEGQLFMDMEHAAKTHALLKHMGRQQEWSFSLHGVKAERDDDGVRHIKKVKIHEVSPVFKGAGIGTRTTRVKAAGEQSEFDRLMADLVERDARIGELVDELAAMRTAEARRLGRLAGLDLTDLS